MLSKSLILKVTYLSGLLLAPSIFTWPGVDISSWPELELLCHSLACTTGGRGKVVAEEGLLRKRLVLRSVGWKDKMVWATSRVDRWRLVLYGKDKCDS